MTSGWIFVMCFSIFLGAMGLILGAREDAERRKRAAVQGEASTTTNIN